VVAVPRDTEAVRRLGLEYAEAIRRSEAAWLYVQQPWDGELQYETFSYVPEHHFRRAYDRVTARDLAPDGGLQIGDPGTDCVWFWYNPSLDSIVQEEVEPYNIRGVFATEDDAYRFLDWYADQYGIADTSHLELYRADLSLEGYGRKYLAAESERSEDPPEQVDFDAFQPATSEATDDAGDGDR
jgi:hypothetical protein